MFLSWRKFDLIMKNKVTCVINIYCHMTVGPEREVNIRVFYTRVEKIFSKVRANWGSSFLVFWKRYKTGGFFTHLHHKT